MASSLNQDDPVIRTLLKRIDQLEASIAMLQARAPNPLYVPKMYQGTLSDDVAPGASGEMTLLSRDNADSGITKTVYNYFVDTTASGGTVWWAIELDGVIRLIVGECP